MNRKALDFFIFGLYCIGAVYVWLVSLWVGYIMLIMLQTQAE